MTHFFGHTVRQSAFKGFRTNQCGRGVIFYANTVKGYGILTFKHVWFAEFELQRCFCAKFSQSNLHTKILFGYPFADLRGRFICIFAC